MAMILPAQTAFPSATSTIRGAAPKPGELLNPQTISSSAGTPGSSGRRGPGVFPQTEPGVVTGGRSSCCAQESRRAGDFGGLAGRVEGIDGASSAETRMDLRRRHVALRTGNLSQRQRREPGIPPRICGPTRDVCGRSDKQHRVSSDEAETPHRRRRFGTGESALVPGDGVALRWRSAAGSGQRASAGRQPPEPADFPTVRFCSGSAPQIRCEICSSTIPYRHGRLRAWPQRSTSS